MVGIKEIDNNYQLGIQCIAMQDHRNNHGTIFGGWLMSQLDLAGSIICRTLLQQDQEIVTVSVSNLVFEKPIYAGDVIQCWVAIEKVGKSSITTKIQTNAVRKGTQIVDQKVAHGKFIYVCVKDGKPDPIMRKQ